MLESILTVIVFILGIILLPFTIYQFFIGLHFFKKDKEVRKSEKFNKFAVLIAARNEEKVIGKLIESLHNMNYPKNRYEIIVAANNCTDDTRGVAERLGVRLFDVEGTVRTKGDVLHEMFNYLIKHEDYEAYVVFDADNIVTPNFLIEMNNAIENGYSAAQGFRDSKNPHESAISGAYTIYHYLINSFYNYPRNKMNINNILVGCGFMATKSIIEELGGWNTKTITEDLEFTVLTTMHGAKIGFCENAIFYDEQPNTFEDSWHQRMRWTVGVRQGFDLNIKKLISQIFKEGKIKRFDNVAFLSMNLISNLSLIEMVLATILVCIKTTYIVGFTMFGINLLSMIVVPSIFALFILAINEKPILPMWKGILFFGIFLISWIPINLCAGFIKNIEWKEMKHDSKVEVNIK